MLPDRVSNPGPLTYESGALPIALRGPAKFETVFQSILRKIQARENIPNKPHPHLLQAQKALTVLLSKLVERPGTES